MWVTIGSDGRRVQVGGNTFTIGRDETCDLVLDDVKVSRNHALIETLPSGQATIRDLGSTNGTFLNGRRLTDPAVLEGGEQIRVGDTVLSLSRDGGGTVAAPLAPGAKPKPGTATMERQFLRRSVRRATMLAGAAVVALILVVVLFVTGVLPPGGVPSVREIVDAIKPSTVLVLVYDHGDLAGNGSGWVLDASKGLIVTNAHVVDAGSTFAVAQNGDKRPAKVLGVAPCRDLAVLQVSDTDGLKTLPLGSQADVQQGDVVVALGYPVNASLQENLVATSGVVSVVRQRYTAAEALPIAENVLLTTAQINPGNSGGPLVDTDEHLVGVNTLVFIRNNQIVPGQNYAIGVDLVKQVVPELTRGRSIAWNGMDLDVGDQDELLSLGAVPNTPAAKAGFGDTQVQITSIDGTPMTHGLRSYCAAVGAKRRGSSAVFTISDGSSEQDVRVAFS